LALAQPLLSVARMKTLRALFVLSVVSASLAACIIGGPDYCSGPITSTATPVACQALRPDGGPASGVFARCTQGDAGALTDSTGALTFVAHKFDCGIAAGSYDCGSLEFVEDGGVLLTSLGDAGAPLAQQHPGNLTGGSCQLHVP
jgi:hypothetical protein